MPIDSNIFAQIKPPEPVNPLNALAQMSTIQTGMNTNRLADLVYGEKQRDLAGDGALAKLLSGGSTPEDVARGLASQGYGTKSLAYTKQQQELTKQQTEIAKMKAETGASEQGTADKRLSMIGQTLGSLMTIPNVTPDHVSRAMQHLVDIDIIKPEMAQKIIAGAPQDPVQLAEFLKTGRDRVMTADKQRSFTDVDANTAANNKTSIFTNAATNATHVQTTGMTNATTRRGQDMTDARAKEATEGAQEAFSPDAIKNAAARYNIDGTLPPMGMGKAGSAGRAAILNEAAVQAGASGISGDDQRIAQIGNKANTAALSKIQQSQTMVGAFEKNFTRNADIALEESKKVDGTGVPLANKWINSGKRAITGDPQLSAYDAVIKSTANEYAKIISGSMGNTASAESEIKKVEALLNSAQTPAQVEAVINMMKRETQNRMKGFEEEKAVLRSSMTAKKPVASDPAPTKASPIPAGWSVKAH